MGIFSSINIAASGLSAQRLRQDVIGNNLANVNSTRTPEGGPFKRSRVIFTAQTEDPYWKGPFTPRSMDNGGGRGVKASSVEKDTDTPGRLVYDPTHPDAIKSGKRVGYVEYSNVNVVSEMTDLISAERAYQANIQVLNTAKTMFEMALQIGS